VGLAETGVSRSPVPCCDRDLSTFDERANQITGEDVIKVTTFESQLLSRLPATYSLLMTANLMVDTSVSRITLHGSRGLAGGYRQDSDIDLSLVVDTDLALSEPGLEAVLDNVWETTANNWQGTTELDLAVIYDARICDLKCFSHTSWNEQLCEQGGTDCFGLYKKQKGFSGIVKNGGVQTSRMYPCLEIWQAASGQAVSGQR